MRHKGTYTELEIDIDETTGDIRDAVVTESKISIDWAEDDVEFYPSLHSTDGIEYQGNQFSTTHAECLELNIRRPMDRYFYWLAGSVMSEERVGMLLRARA